MNTTDFARLPISVREAANRIADAEVEQSPSMQSLLAEQKVVRDEHAAGVQELLRIKEAAQEALSRASVAERKIEEIRADREGLARRVILGQSPESEDAQLQAESANLKRQADLFRLGADAVHDDVRRAHHLVGVLAGRVTETEQKVELHRRTLKVEAARRLTA